MTRTSLTIDDFSDHELLYALQDHVDDDGFIGSQELADHLGLSNLGNPSRNVSSRLAYLRRIGIVQRDEHKTGKRWGLSPVGKQIMDARLTSDEAKLLEGIDEAKLLAVMQRVGRKMTHANAEAATMAQRDFRNAQATRKRLLAA